ncbi:MAG: carboxypeptidase-like regulatory domain-containing protein, partial [Candidatus Sumerlaeia bacterium]|nr:carboxypeptidase-like regulatory domain-containing protein [Candidatus Sumerlaeia bacterium]
FEFAHIAPMGTLDIRHPLYEPLTHRFELEQDETLSLELRSKPSITLQLTADSELLVTGNAHLLQLNTRLLGEGQSHPFGEIINTLHESGATEYRFVPAQEGDFIVAYGSGDSWAVSSVIPWRLGSAESTINLSVPQRSTVRVTSSAITQENSAEWSLELVNTTIPEHVAKLDYSNPRWSSGSLEFTSVPHGWYYLTAFHPEFGARTVANINVDSPSENLTLEMEAARYDIEGLLLDSDSKPLASATLELYSGETGTPLDSTTSSATGSFEFLLLNRESAYQLVVTLPGRREVINLSPWNDPAPLRSVVYELPRECLYLVAPPPGAAAAGVPYFLQHETQSHQHTLFAEDFAKPIALREGTYLLSRGEERAGTLKVPPCTGRKDAPIGITPNWIP